MHDHDLEPAELGRVTGGVSRGAKVLIAGGVALAASLCVLADIMKDGGPAVAVSTAQRGPSK